jgi:hypothetical protein
MAGRKRGTSPAAIPASVGRAGGGRGRNGPAPPPRTGKWLPGNPEWEAAKAATRNLSHDAAVAESVYLSNLYRTMWRAMASVQVDFGLILRTLTEKKVPFVLTGAQAIGGWTGRPRATHDVDILVKGGRNHARAVKALRALYPQLEVHSLAGVVSFFVPGEKQSVIDVTYPHRADIEETLRTAIWVGEGAQRHRIPTLEAALANKYGAMLTPTRDAGKRGLDATDFYYMVRHSTEAGRQPIDLDRLAVLGEKVWPGGGGEEILRLVEQVKAGQLPDVTPRAGSR